VAWLGVALWQANPVRVGDGHEHVAVALAFARGQGSAFAPDQIPSLEAELRALGPSFATASLVHPDLVGRDGRQDVPHFWLYPLLAAPWVWLALTCGVSPLWGFVMLHALLLGGLTALILARPAPVWTSLLLLSPLVWWIDKPSADLLLVSCLEPIQHLRQDVLDRVGIESGARDDEAVDLGLQGPRTWHILHRDETDLIELTKRVHMDDVRVV